MAISPFDHHLGLELLHCDEQLVTARVPVRPQLTQPIGIVHGGVYAAIAEAIASLGTNRAVAAEGMVGLGQSNNCSFLRPVSAGAVHATARVRHRGRTSQVWDVELCDDDGRLCAMARVTVAVRPLRPAAAAT
ncbi:thioesterase superfamily protein [Conexibacter woesei DSM 14684]|uniref:Thioesterase superfamily protein n=2 Tax=Conexibacter TaxID=191494 RepID=D3F5B1_CONWI|nr:thioesterase superfamily protein [Conexibacter woesei DSM 14684]